MKNWMVLGTVLVIALAAGAASAELNYEYFEGSWDYLPDFDSLTPAGTGTDPNFYIGNRNQDDYFGFRFTGYISVSTNGIYTFYTSSDDGSALYIGNTYVVNNDGLHGMQERSGSINLTAGRHALTVTFFEKTGSEGLEISYEGPEITKQLIPESMLFLETNTAGYPEPGHETRRVDPGVVLSWQAPGLVTNPLYDVYFGTDPNFPGGPRITRQSATTFDPCAAAELALGTDYYWRIDVYDPAAEVTYQGNLWSFSTHFGPVMLALYEFEDSAEDTSGNGYYGSFEGGADIHNDAERGKVLNLDGADDYVEIGKTASFLGIDGNAAKTVAAWVYTRSFNDGGVFDVGAHTNGQEFCLRTMGDDNQWRIQYYGNYDLDFSYDSLNKWVHFALVHDGSTTKLYADGSLIRAQPRVLNTTGGETFKIGQYGSHFFDGLIDNLSIWNYALTRQEVRALMPMGDYDSDGDVDAADLKTIAADWLTDNTVPGSVLDPNILDDFEGYSGMLFPIIFWIEYEVDAGTHNSRILLQGGYPNAHGGDQALRFDYEYPVNTEWITIGHRLINPNSTIKQVDLSRFDEVRLWVKCHPDNQEKVVWYMHMANNPPDVIEHEAARLGPFSTLGDPDDPNAWTEWVIDLRGPNVEYYEGYSGPEDVNYMHGILFSAQNTSSEATTGRLDFDDIRLEDHTPDCTGIPAADLNDDCVVDLFDFEILAANWLKGT